MDNAKLIEVIETSLIRRGKGTEADPVRIVKQYWAKDGSLLAERDDYAAEVSSGDPCGFVVVAGKNPLMDTVAATQAKAIEKFKAYYKDTVGGGEQIVWMEYSQVRGYDVRPLRLS
jgi:hypothetical protein